MKGRTMRNEGKNLIHEAAEAHALEHTEIVYDKIRMLEDENKKLKTENKWLLDAMRQIGTLNAGCDTDIRWLVKQALKGGAGGVADHG
jgi:hypothetical protein